MTSLQHQHQSQSLDPGPAPASVRAVFWLVIVQAVLGLAVGLPVAYLSKDAILAQQPATPGVDAEAVWSAGFAIGVVVAIGSALMWLLFAVKLKEGRNWARITMIVLSVISLVFTPINLLNTAGATPVVLLSSLPGLVITVVILVLLARDPAKSWTPAKTAYLKSGTPF
ncbi:MAG: hypothetical protein GEV10_03675 [Streptosporangiales bacterium]|nr:hypothetical protein [Streptosporangiales bacterium]